MKLRVQRNAGEFFWLAVELSASQEGLSSVELVGRLVSYNEIIECIVTEIANVVTHGMYKYSR